jgi:hypothetical protein
MNNFLHDSEIYSSSTRCRVPASPLGGKSFIVFRAALPILEACNRIHPYMTSYDRSSFSAWISGPTINTAVLLFGNKLKDVSTFVISPVFSISIVSLELAKILAWRLTAIFAPASLVDALRHHELQRMACSSEQCYGATSRGTVPLLLFRFSDTR